TPGETLRRRGNGSTGRATVLQQLLLRGGRRRAHPPPEVRVRERRRDAPLRRAREEALLDEEGLVDVLNRVALLADGRGERVDPDRPAAELVDDGEEEGAVHLIEPRLVDVEQGERIARDGPRDPPLGTHLGEVAHAAQQPVRDARRAARTARELGPTVLVEGDAEDRRRAAEDLLEILAPVKVEPERRAEAVAERRGEEARARRGADQAEGLERQLDRARGRPLADHEVE